jgi:cell division protein FtsI (penicillin-binding protein 3)
LYAGIRKFGFGSRSGVPLLAESGGLLRPDSRWNPDTILSVPMGHEVSTTTMQLAQACSVIANGGMLVKPRLILKKHRPDGTVIEIPVARTERVLAPQRSIEMRQMMEGVVTKGTGKGAKLDGYSSGGKTGSAQIYDYKLRHYTHTYNASFMGFAPVTNPAIVVVVTINGTSGGSSGYGGAVAAPVFKSVAQEALRVMEVQKDLPEVEPESEEPADDDTDVNDVTAPLLQASLDPNQIPPELGAGAGKVTQDTEPAEKKVFGPRVPDFSGKSIRAVMEEAAALGLPVIVDGKGRARVQVPAAGAVLPPGESIRVQFVR